MNIIEVLNKLRKDIQTWVRTNVKKILQTLDSHISDNNRHITSAERESWFSGEYTDLQGAPSISGDDAENSLSIVDPNGNIVFKVDSQGVQTTALAVKSNPTFYIVTIGPIQFDDNTYYYYSIPVNENICGNGETIYIKHETIVLECKKDATGNFSFSTTPFA